MAYSTDLVFLVVLWRLRYKLSLRDLAEMVGTYRETVTKVLNELQAADLIELRQGKIVMLEVPGLEHFQSHAGSAASSSPG